MKISACRTLIGLLLAAAATLASAQEFPSAPIRLVSAYPPGSAPDLVPRAIGQALTGILGQPVVIENRPGGGGMVALQEVTKSPPNGYTLLGADAGQWAIFPAMRPGLYDFQRELTPVALVMSGAVFIIVPESFPAKNLQEFIAYARANPGKLNYGTAGNGSLHHLAMESFNSALGLTMVHVPYKGSGQSVAALMGGQINVLLAGIVSLRGQLKAGQVRLIAASTAKRSRFAPEVPALTEAGASLSDIDFRADSGFFAPAGTPKPIVDKLTSALQRAVQSPEVIQRIETIGLEAVFGNAEQLAELVRADIPRYSKAVRISGAKVD